MLQAELKRNADGRATAEAGASRAWPVKLNLFDVRISRTAYDEAVACIIGAARQRRPALVTAFAAHGVVLASEDPAFRARINDFDLVTPDGQAVRHALNLLYGSGMRDRVYGPELTLRLCRKAAELDIGIYLYGSTPDTVTRMRGELRRRHPRLRIVGYEPSVFRPLTWKEDAELNDRINRSGAGLLFVGLGCPRQEVFAHERHGAVRAVQVCVGAAFDFIAGTKRSAPRWMQDHALEWLFRLGQEPHRLFRRYMVTNGKFLVRFGLQATGLKIYRGL